MAIAAGKGYVYTAGADGSLRSWSVDKATGDMAEWAMQEGAHDGRICVLVLHGDHLYSSGVDGVIRMWNKDTMEMMGQVSGRAILRRIGLSCLTRKWMDVRLLWLTICGLRMTGQCKTCLCLYYVIFR